MLSRLIARNPKKPGDVSTAPGYDYKVYADLKARRHHIIEVAFNSLPEQLQKLLSEAAAFRSTIAYDSLSLFNDFGNDLEFEEALKDLVDWGLLLFNEDNNFDLHPIVRRYAYDSLGDKKITHIKLKEYFNSNLPWVEKVKSLDEISPIMDLYYHTAKAGEYEKALKLYITRLDIELYSWFGAYQIIVELLQLQFPEGFNKDLCLLGEKDQAIVLNKLGRAYDKLGQTRLAMYAYNRAVEIAEIYCDKDDLDVYRSDLSSLLIDLGRLELVGKNLKYNVRKPIKNIGQLNLASCYGYLLSIEGFYTKSIYLFNDMIKRLNKGKDNEQALSVVFHSKSRVFIFMKRPNDAYKAAIQSLHLWEKSSRKQGPNEVDRIYAEWFIAQALIYLALNDINKKSELLSEAEFYLKETLRRCHSINLVKLEPDILLSMALFHFSKGEIEFAKELADEALYIANRCEYRINQAEIHNFIARLCMDQNDFPEATRHAQIAYEHALCDGPPHCYKPALDDAKELLRKLGGNGT